MKRWIFVLAAAVALVLAVVWVGSRSTVAAAVIYDEAVDGDLPNICGPKSLGVLSPGSFTVKGQALGGDRDSFSFSIPAGAQLTDFTLDSLSQSGTTSFTLMPHFRFLECSGGTTVPLIGPTTVGAGNVGTDLLGGTDFAGPNFGVVMFGFTLGSSASYQLTFTVAVPPPDADGDGVSDAADNCPAVANPGQADLDGDTIGDACDPDIDGDGVLNAADNCPAVSNPDQSPSVTAALVPVGQGDNDGTGGDDSDEGRFRVDFTATNPCGLTLTVVATLSGDAFSIAVTNGQILELELENDGTEIEVEGAILEIEAPSFTLTVTATDPFGNVGTATATPAFLTGDNDGAGDLDD